MASNAQGNPKENIRIVNITHRKVIVNDPKKISDYIIDMPPERLREAVQVSQLYHFRVPDFYFRRVLNGSPDDPLIDIVIPSEDELEDGEELWDNTPSPYRASDSPFWIQKYEYQGLIRITTACSGLCRFCYL